MPWTISGVLKQIGRFAVFAASEYGLLLVDVGLQGCRGPFDCHVADHRDAIDQWRYDMCPYRAEVRAKEREKDFFLFPVHYVPKCVDSVFRSCVDDGVGGTWHGLPLGADFNYVRMAREYINYMNGRLLIADYQID